MGILDIVVLVLWGSSLAYMLNDSGPEAVEEDVPDPVPAVGAEGDMLQDAEDPAQQDEPDNNDAADQEDDDAGDAAEDDTPPVQDIEEDEDAADDDPMVRANNALGADATDFLFGPSAADNGASALDFIVDEEVTSDTETVVLADEQDGSVLFEDRLDVQFLAADSGPQIVNDDAADIYMIGSDAADDVRVQAGRVVANLGGGDDIYSDEGLETGVRVLDEDDDFVENGVASLSTEFPSLGLARGVENSGVNSDIQRVFAGDGNDTIDVRAAGGLVYAGNGNDEILVSDTGTYARGGAGDDVISHVADPTFDGDFEGNWLLGEDGDDTITGSTDADVLYGDSAEGQDGDGNDSLNAGDGDDLVWGGGGSDSIDGGAGDDEIYGAAATYFINVTPSNGDGTNFDWYTDQAADTLIAGDGDDVVYADQFDTIDLAHSEAGADTDRDNVFIAHDTRLDSDRVALVQNFDPEDDDLHIRLDPSQLPADAINEFYNTEILEGRSLRSDDGDAGILLEHELTVVGGDTVVSFNGINVAVLEGITEDQHEDLDIEVRVWLEVAETDPYRE